MQVIKDHFGNEVFIGDALVHVVKQSTSVGIHYSIVYGFIWRGDKHVEAKVVSVRKHCWKKDEYMFYRSTLTSNNFVKIPTDSIPLQLRTGLLDKIKRY